MSSPLFPAVGADGRLPEKHLPVHLSETDLHATYVRPDDLSNPESATSNAVQGLIDTSLAGFSPTGVVRRHMIGANLNTARPAYAGPVNWVQTVGPTAVPLHIAEGDEITYVEAVAVPWSPSQLPGLAAWYDAQSITAAADSAVPQWSDLSGQGRHMVQATEAAQPTYRAAGINAHPSVQFDGTADHLVANIASYVGPWTVYLVGQSLPATLSGGSDFIIGGAGAANPSQRLDIYRSTASAAVITRGTALTGPALDNAVHRIKAVFNGTTSAVQVDNGASTTGTTPMSGVDIVKLTLGARADNANWFDGHLGEVIYVQGVVSTEDDAKVAAYLQGRWGVS